MSQTQSTNLKGVKFTKLGGSDNHHHHLHGWLQGLGFRFTVSELQHSFSTLLIHQVTNSFHSLLTNFVLLLSSSLMKQTNKCFFLHQSQITPIKQAQFCHQSHINSIKQAQFCHQSHINSNQTSTILSSIKHINSMVQSYTNKPMHNLVLN